MLSLSNKSIVWIGRVIALAWGFALIQLFRYILDNIYPFWSVKTNLSLFAYFLLFIAWLSYTLFFNFRPYRNTVPRFIYHFIFTANAVIFYFFVSKLGEETYLYYYPLAFSFQFFVYFFLFTSIFPALMRYKIFILSGFLLGLITYSYVSSIYIDIFLPAIIYILPYRVISSGEEVSIKSHGRMLPFRQSIDLLRYLFLAFSFFGIFDIYRDRFYLTAFILGSGPALSVFFQIADRKKHHVKYGIVIIALFFLGLGFLGQYITLNYWAAFSFSFLTVWESIYFKRDVGSDLKREQLLSGLALLLVTFYYFITPEWFKLINTLIIFSMVLRIAFYFIKSYRKTISLFFVAALVAWLWIVFLSVSDSLKREFFTKNSADDVNPPATLAVFGIMNPQQNILATNLFPPEALKGYAKNNKNPIIPVEVNALTFLQKAKSLSQKNPNAIQIYNLGKTKPYNTEKGEKEVFKFIQENHISNFYLYSSELPGSYYDQDKTYEFPSLSLQVLPAAAAANNSSFDPTAVYDVGTSISNWYTQEGNYEYSLRVLNELNHAYEKPEILRQIAHIYGILGDVPKQIEFRQKIIDRGFADKTDKSTLMELYYLSNEPLKAEELCDQLLYEDGDHLLTYLEWKYKIIKMKKNKYQMIVLKNTVLGITRELSKEETLRKNILLRKIREDLSASPDYNELYLKEKNRQEHIVYPE